MSQHPALCVVIVGYQSQADLPDCLTSLFHSTYRNFSVFFLDNTGNSACAELIAQSYPQVTVVPNQKNLGFATGNNRVIQHVLDAKLPVDAFFLLNPDTVIEPDCLTQLAAKFSPTRILQPLILLHKDGQKTKLVNTFGNPLHYLGFSYAGGNGTPVPTHTAPQEIALASGAALLVPAALLRQIGLFDESFFMYQEDTDLSWRCRLVGATIQCIPTALVWHKYHFSRNTNKFFYAERNRLSFLIKNLQAGTLFLIAPALILTDVFMLLYAILGGWGWTKIRANLQFISRLPATLSQRRSIQVMRTVSDAELASLMTAKLSFSEVDGLPIKLYNLFSNIYWLCIKPFLP